MEGKLDRPSHEKVAVVLQLLGGDLAAKVLQNLPMTEVRRLALTIMRMDPPDIGEARNIAKEFITTLNEGGELLGGEEFARALVEKAYGKGSASRLLETLLNSSEGADTFLTLNHADPKVIAEFIKNEHPQTIAVILAHLDPAVGGRVLSSLDDSIRTEVILRTARLQEVSPQILKEVSEILQNELLDLGVTTRDIGGLNTVAEILNHAEKSVETEIMQKIRQEDTSLAEEIQQLMFLFDDLVKLEDRAIQEVLREIDTNLLAKALRAANEEVRDKIYQNMSKRAGLVLQEELDSMGPTRLSEVEEAQMEIIMVILRLRDEGRITIRSASEEDVFV